MKVVQDCLQNGADGVRTVRTRLADADAVRVGRAWPDMVTSYALAIAGGRRAGLLRGDNKAALRGRGRRLGCCGCVLDSDRGVAEKQGVRSAFGYRDMPHPHPIPILPHLLPCLLPCLAGMAGAGGGARANSVARREAKADEAQRGRRKTGGRVLERGRRKNNKPPAAVVRLWQSRRVTGSNPVCGLHGLLSYMPHDGWRFCELRDGRASGMEQSVPVKIRQQIR